MKKIKRLWKLFVNNVLLLNTEAVVEWWQEGNTITLKIQKCGLFKRYVGIPFICTIDIDPSKVVQSQ